MLFLFLFIDHWAELSVWRWRISRPSSTLLVWASTRTTSLHHSHVSVYSHWNKTTLAGWITRSLPMVVKLACRSSNRHKSSTVVCEFATRIVLSAWRACSDRPFPTWSSHSIKSRPIRRRASLVYRSLAISSSSTKDSDQCRDAMSQEPLKIRHHTRANLI